MSGVGVASVPATKAAVTTTEAAEASSLERLEVKGGPRLRGQAHGAAHRALIAEGVSNFMQATAALRAPPDGAERWKQAVEGVTQRLGRDAPQALEELEGIAAEAGVEPSAHVAYALEEDLLPTLDLSFARERIDTWLGSDVLAVPNMTGRLTRILFRMDRAGPLTLIDHVGESVEMPMLVAGRPGTLGCFGINRDGLACARQPLLNGPFVADGMLSHALFRQILTSKEHSSATTAASRWSPASGVNFFVADPQKALSVEASHQGSRILGTFTLSAVAAHTNHRVGPVPPDDVLAQRSLERLKRMRSLIPSREDPELKLLIKKFQAATPPVPGRKARLLFAANLKPSGTQLSWRSELAAP